MKLLFLLWILPLTLGDAPITCVYSKECILPCTTKHIGIIHWYKDKIQVHSFYHNQDQFDYQSEEYKGRTSLFPKSEIQKGNVSLLLKHVKVRDQGTYRCYAADDKLSDEKLMSVSVEAPVKAVDITLKDDTVICNTSGVYPEPDVSWSSSNPLAKEPVNSFLEAEENLFTVTSKLKVGVNKTYTYKCSIKNKDKTKTLYTATLEQQELQMSDEFFVKCPVSKDLNYTLTLSFSTTILRYDSKTSMKEISEPWTDKVTFHPENGTVKVSDPNKEHSGTYTCECTTAQHRYITKTVVSSRGKQIVIASIIISSLAIVAIALVVIFRKKLQKIFSRKPPKVPDEPSLKGKTSEMENNGEEHEVLRIENQLRN